MNASTNVIEQFRAAIVAAGLTPPDDIHADGKLHRFPSNGRRNDDSGWYVLHPDGVAAGSFGCWREGISRQWCSKSIDSMTEAERDAHRQRVQAMRQQREADTAERQQHAATVAAQRWHAATPATKHPYLSAKGVQSHGLRMEREALLIPMRDTSGTLHSLQTIDPKGSKRFLPGGRVKGCLHLIGTPERDLIVCEGYATGASIHQATGLAVAVAFNAGNLLEVAQSLRSKYPALRLIVAADDDWHTEGNPGLTKARQAAQAVGGLLALPEFGNQREPHMTDFNDLHQRAGLGDVALGIESARAPAAAAPAAPKGRSFEPLGDELRELVPEAVGNQWDEPVPLPDALPPVAPFDAELLPEALRGWVADIAHRMQCPPDFLAVGALVALSSLIGARAVVAPKERDDWRVVPNLWGKIVARPGGMKSPAISEVLKPLHRLEATERKLWQAAHDEWELVTKVAKLAASQNEKEAASFASKDPDKARKLLEPKDVPAEPKARRYVVNDSTVEALQVLLQDNQWGLLAYRDELHGLLGSMEKPGQEGARGFYLQCYDGNQAYTVDRIGRGPDRHIPRACLAMLGGIQPGKLQSYVREAVAGGTGDDGLLQRFGLAVWPDVSREFKRVDQWPDTKAKQTASEIFERLNQLQQPASESEPQVWRFSPSAQALYWEWAQPFESEIRGEELHPALVSHLSKYRKLVPALALIFALVDTPDSGNVIHERELLRALAWADYLRTHAERIYSAALIPETAGAKQLLDKIKAGKLCADDGELQQAFTPRLVAVKHWAGLGKPEDVRKAADLLVDYGWLKRELIPAGAAGGRPSERYLMHPMLQQRSSQ